MHDASLSLLHPSLMQLVALLGGSGAFMFFLRRVCKFSRTRGGGGQCGRFLLHLLRPDVAFGPPCFAEHGHESSRDIALAEWYADPRTRFPAATRLSADPESVVQFAAFPGTRPQAARKDPSRDKNRQVTSAGAVMQAISTSVYMYIWYPPLVTHLLWWL